MMVPARVRARAGAANAAKYWRDASKVGAMFLKGLCASICHRVFQSSNSPSALIRSPNSEPSIFFVRLVSGPRRGDRHYCRPISARFLNLCIDQTIVKDHIRFLTFFDRAQGRQIAR